MNEVAAPAARDAIETASAPLAGAPRRLNDAGRCERRRDARRTGAALGARPRVSRHRAGDHGRRDDLGVGAQPGRRDLECRRFRRDRVGLDAARSARRRNRRHRRAHIEAVRRQSDHDAPASRRADRGLHRPPRRACRARRRHSGERGDPAPARRRRPRHLLRAGLRDRPQAGARRGRCDRRRGQRGRRPYRAGLDRGVGTGSASPSEGGAGVCRRRDRARRGNRVVS